MVNFCSECGFKIEETHKFCPNCGNKIVFEDSVEKPLPDESTSSEEKFSVIICSNCGGENKEGIEICSDCGVPLHGERKISLRSSQKLKSNAQPPEKKTKKSSKNSDEKVLDIKSIIAIGSVLGIVVFVILFTSGVFEGGKPAEDVHSEVRRGVDLNNISAINEYEEKVKANPDDLESLLHLAHLQNDSHFYEKAIENYKKYLAAKPDNANARVDMGICYYNLGNYTAAMEEMEKAINYQPTHQIAHLNLGIVNLSSGNLEKSKEWFRKAVDINPDSEAARRAKELLNSH